MISKNRKYPLVYIEWEDSARNGGWEIVSNMVPDIVICRSVGFLLNETKSFIQVVPHLSDENSQTIALQGCGGMTIPKRAIVKRSRL